LPTHVGDFNGDGNIDLAVANRDDDDCLRALGLRQRGIYTCKDTFVSRMLEAGAKIAWLEQQTGVSYATLRRHYGRWMPTDGETELHRLEAIDPDLFGVGAAILSPTKLRRGGQFPKRRVNTGGKKCEEGDLNPKKGPK
jgi:hypothetical protein